MRPLYFFPDSVDTIDPMYDFAQESYGTHRVRQQREEYAHEALVDPPYDGILLSMAMAGFRAGAAGRGPSRFTESQRFRLYYSGADRYYRLRRETTRLLSMGDTGAYAYADQDNPPVSVSDVLDFYETAGFDIGLAPDHLVPGFSEDAPAPPLWHHRRDFSLELAEAFLREHGQRRCQVTPIGVAQGWSPASYAESARVLEAMGYTYIAAGGLAPLGTNHIMQCVEAMACATSPHVRFHLLGLARLKCLANAKAWRVASFDTTSPLRQAFQDNRHNYHCPSGAHYVALRVPSWEGNPRMERRTRDAGLHREHVRRLERDALAAVRSFAQHGGSVASTVARIVAYEQIFSGRDQSEAYGRLLSDRPWESCPCTLCHGLGVEVVIYRGAERNRRRGFHNLYVFHRRLAALDGATL